MKIAIHSREGGFSKKWLQYCRNNKISYKIVDCYDNNIIGELQDCDALMWHFHHKNPKDVLFAKQLLYSLENSGKKVFPDFKTVWFFDDKVGQKYLLESIGVPTPSSCIFYEKNKALKWIEHASFPRVFKLRSGAGSTHVKIVETAAAARKFVKKAFRDGFSQYDKWGNLSERWYKYQKGKISSWDLIKGVFRLGRTTNFARVSGNEKGYVYFQDFIPGNDSDIRVIVIDGKAFAIKRMVRDGDFRASGSGSVLYDKHYFKEETISLSFEIAEKLNSQCLALDYLYQDGKPLIVEISFGFTKEVYYPCQGYWDRNLNWYPGPFDAQGWMVEAVVKEVEMGSGERGVGSRE